MWTCANDVKQMCQALASIKLYALPKKNTARKININLFEMCAGCVIYDWGYIAYYNSVVPYEPPPKGYQAKKYVSSYCGVAVRQDKYTYIIKIFVWSKIVYKISRIYEHFMSIHSYHRNCGAAIATFNVAA